MQGWDEMPLDTFAPLGPLRPYTVLDRHPSGQYVALQCPSAPLDRAGVWEVASGALVWAPAQTVAVCWLHDGTEVLLLRERDALSPADPAPTASPLEGHDWYLLERQSWPGHVRHSACEVVLAEGWANAVSASPRGDLAAVRWFEQDAAGFVLVAVRDTSDRQLPTYGYRVTETNLMQGPVFSPDGRYLAVSCGRNLWWTGDRDSDDPATPAQGGRYVIGHVAIYDVATEAAREIPIEVDVPVGWLPDDPEEPLAGELLGTPQFVTVRDFTVALPTGGERQYSVDDVA